MARRRGKAPSFSTLQRLIRHLSACSLVEGFNFWMSRYTKKKQWRWMAGYKSISEGISAMGERVSVVWNVLMGTHANPDG
jgi:hypothetical protein